MPSAYRSPPRVGAGRVCADATRGDVLLCQVTIKSYGHPHVLELSADGFAQGGLPRPSWILPHRLVTAHEANAPRRPSKRGVPSRRRRPRRAVARDRDRRLRTDRCRMPAAAQNLAQKADLVARGGRREHASHEPARAEEPGRDRADSAEEVRPLAFEARAIAIISASAAQTNRPRTRSPIALRTHVHHYISELAPLHARAKARSDLAATSIRSSAAAAHQEPPPPHPPRSGRAPSRSARASRRARPGDSRGSAWPSVLERG